VFPTTPNSIACQNEVILDGNATITELLVHRVTRQFNKTDEVLLATTAKQQYNIPDTQYKKTEIKRYVKNVQFNSIYFARYKDIYKLH